MQVFKSIIFFFIIICSFCVGAFFYIANQPWVDFSRLEHYNPGQSSILYDINGKEWGRFQLDKRELIKLKDIPQCIINAFIAGEDWDFFKHNGISIKGIIRSTFVNIYHRRIVQGASTITQQLIKLLYFDLSRKFTRKIKEQILALLVERQFTKEQILEIYLNHVCFGYAIYGVEAACQRFWNKSVKDISIDEAAVLAAIVRSPQRYCPLYNSEPVRRPRNAVLTSMLKLNFISEEEYEKCKIKPIYATQSHNNTLALHLKETIRINLEEKFGKKLVYTGGLKIYTTLDMEIQKKSESIFQEKLKDIRQNRVSDIEGALISLDTKTGGIRALVGGYDYKESQFNRAFNARRQIGSTFKPLIYAVGIEKGYSFANLALDEPFTLESNNTYWSPQNSTKKFEGPITLAYALSRSNNIVTIKLLLALGIKAIIKRAKDCQLTSNFPPYPSLALGCVDCSLQETAAFINIFANNGIYTKPYFIISIKDQWGNKLLKNKPSEKVIFSPKVTSQVTKVLSLSMERVRKILGERALSCEAFGKTGTTNDFRTCWFAGSTPNLTTALYLGCDDNRSLYGKSIYASRTALPLWYNINRQFIHKNKHFSYSPELKEITINDKTGSILYSIQEPHAISLLVDPTSYYRNTEPLF